MRLEPAEAAVVAELFHRYQQERQSLVGLTKELMRQQIPTPRGKRRWNQATVRGILCNPVYTGTVYIGRYRLARARHRQSALRPVGHEHGGHPATGPQEWEAVAQVPAIITQDQFDLVQAKLAQNQQYARRNNTAHPYLLRALVSCGSCHLSCTGRYRKTKDAEYAYYTRTRARAIPLFLAVMRGVDPASFPLDNSMNWSGRISVTCSRLRRGLRRRCTEHKEGCGFLRSYRRVGRICAKLG